MYLCLYPFWIDTQMQNTQIGVDTGIQIYNDVERFRAVEITIYDCRYSAHTACFVKIDLRVAPAWWPSCRTSSTTARWPGDVTRCDQMKRPVEKIFSCEVSSGVSSVSSVLVVFHRVFLISRRCRAQREDQGAKSPTATLSPVSHFAFSKACHPDRSWSRSWKTPRRSEMIWSDMKWSGKYSEMQQENETRSQSHN